MDFGNSSNLIFFSPFEGKFTRGVQQGTPGALTRTLKSGKEVNYVNHDFVSGYITNLEIKNSEWGDKLQIFIDDEGVVSLMMLSTPASGFLNKMENIDFSQPVKFVMYRIQGDDKISRDFMGLYQGGNKIENKYSKENPQGKPDWEAKEINGQKQWDRTAEMNYFKGIIENSILPKIKALKSSNTIKVEDAVASSIMEPDPASVQAESVSGENGKDDLPF